MSFPAISVLDHGAVGDGSTDNLAAFSNALAAASLSGGGLVVVPPGVFRVSGGFSVPSSVALVGCGPGSEIKNTSTGGNSAIILQGSKASVKDIKLTRTSDNSILRVQAPDCRVDRVWISVSVGTTRGPLSVDSAGDNCTISDCVIENVGTLSNYFGISANGTSGLVVNGCRLKDCSIILNSGNDNAVVSNNVLLGSLGGAGFIQLANGSQGVTNSNVTISNNIVHSAGFGIRVEKTSGGTVTPKRVTVVGNVIRAVPGAINHGITFAAAEQYVCSGNIVDSNGATGLYYAIELADSHYGTVVGNTVNADGCAGGIILDGSHHVSVSANQVLGVADGKIGVSVYASSGDNASDNTVNGNAVVLSGTSNMTNGIAVVANHATASANRNLVVGNSVRGAGGASRAVRVDTNSSGGSVDRTSIVGNTLSNCGISVFEGGTPAPTLTLNANNQT